METRISNVLDDYEKETYLIIRSSYDNMVKEISDAVNNVLTMTSFDFENSIKQGLIKVRAELKNAELLPKDAEVAKMDDIIEEQRKTNRSRTKKEVVECYEEIIAEEDFNFDLKPSHRTNNKHENGYSTRQNNKTEIGYPSGEQSNVQAPQITSSKTNASNRSNNKTSQAQKTDVSKPAKAAFEKKSDATFSKVGHKFQCENCTFSTPDENKMDRHVKHIHRQEGLYNCEKCSYSSVHESRLITHMKKTHNIVRQLTYT